jgi:guanylate kinase
MNPFPLVLSAPSGGGKTTIAHLLLDRRTDVGYSISCTTRPPRTGEADGRDYFFLDREDFEVRRARGDFAESAEVHGNLYGTLRSEVARVLDAGRHVVMDIDVQGAWQFRGAFPESVLVFLLPPSLPSLLERLLGRGTEDPAQVLRRVRSAREELRAASGYHYVLVNDDLERAYASVSAVVDAETIRHERLPQLAEQIGGLVDELDRLILDPSRIETLLT